MSTKPRLSNYSDVRNASDKNHSRQMMDTDGGESVVSFSSGPHAAKVAIRYAWTANEKFNHETFHRMLDEYREAKRRELDLEVKAKQLAAQLARTEEAAKRALIQSDPTARGGAAQKLLDAERSLQKLREENAELRSSVAREKKKAVDAKTAHDETKRRLELALRDQRGMSKRVGDLERKNGALTRKPEDEYWGEEAGRRFAIQQEELVDLREENSNLKHTLTMMDGSGGDSEHQSRLESQVSELTALVKFYEKKISTLAEQQIIAPQDGIPGGPSSDDWILEEHVHKEEMFLLDRKVGKLFTNPGEGGWPRPVGVRTGTEVKMGSQSKMERFIMTLDHHLQSKGERLRELFNEFDLDNSSFLDRRELAKLIQTLMPDCQPRDVEELRTMLDQDGDGQITYEELLGTIGEVMEARTAAKVGKNIQMNDTLERVRDVLKSNRKLAQEAFNELDSDNDSCLHHLEVVRLLRKFLPDMYQKEVRYLLAKLQEWDVAGEGKVSFGEIYQALGLVKMYRVGQGMAGVARAASPSKVMGAPRGASAPGLSSPTRLTLRQSAGDGLKDAFMRERVMQLEAELKAAQQKEGVLEAEANQVNELRRDLVSYKARIEDLQKDMMKLDVISNVGAAETVGDQRLKKAWETASLFKKRYMEHKAELDTIKVTYARMQSQLDETHKLLNEEHRRRFKLEDDSTRLNMELQRIKDLEARLMQERSARVKLEREYLALQDKAFNAPGQQLVEVRQMTEEVFALRRAKAMAEKKEVEVREELSFLREQLDGMSVDQYKAWQKEHGQHKNRVVQLELELQAAQDKLEVYRRTEPPATSDALLGGSRRGPGSLLMDRRPDADKNEEELRLELGQLRDVWRLDQEEVKKLHAVLEIEESKCMEAKAGLEDAHREMERLRRDYQDQIKILHKELEARDEKIRKLEVQLRGAYLGVNNKAARVGGGVRDSQLTIDPDDMSEVGELQNLLELHISDASIFEEAVGKDPSVFFAVDFFMHETQATQVVASNLPNFSTVIQYIVEQEPFLIEYLDTHVLELELNRARGWDYDPIGIARIPLRQLLEDIELGAALGHNLAWHHADVFGADGRRIGRVRYGFRFRKPLDSLIQQYRDFARSKRPSEPDQRDVAFIAVESAMVQPKQASHVKVVIAGCRNLVPTSHNQTCRPYVHYRFPGHRDPHTTKALHGLNPEFRDEATWLIARTPELESNFKTREMQILVFDDAAGNDPQRGIIGVARVPLGDLSRGIPVEGTFRLINPLNQQEAGQIVLGMGWHNPLRLPGEAPPSGAAGDFELKGMLARGPHHTDQSLKSLAASRPQLIAPPPPPPPPPPLPLPSTYGIQAEARQQYALPPPPPSQSSYGIEAEDSFSSFPASKAPKAQLNIWSPVKPQGFIEHSGSDYGLIGETRQAPSSPVVAPTLARGLGPAPSSSRGRQAQEYGIGADSSGEDPSSYGLLSESRQPSLSRGGRAGGRYGNDLDLSKDF